MRELTSVESRNLGFTPFDRICVGSHFIRGCVILVSVRLLKYFSTKSIRYLGRLDTWNVSFFDVDELRYEIKEYNIDLTIYEQFGSGVTVEDLHDQPQNNEGEEFVN